MLTEEQRIDCFLGRSILYHKMLRRAVAEEAGLSRTNWWFF